MPEHSVLTSAESSKLGLVRKLSKLVESSGSGDPEKSKREINGKLLMRLQYACAGIST